MIIEGVLCQPEAWMVADRLLNVEGTELEFQAFGAQMLRNKVSPFNSPKL